MAISSYRSYNSSDNYPESSLRVLIAMFEKLDVLPPDPILGLSQEFVASDHSELATSLKGRYNTVMTPGGCGALRLAAETIVSAKENATIWFSTPTWGNHYPLLTSAGLTPKEYAYYDIETGGVDFDAMMADLATVPAGDLVLLHACCHNPTGADLTEAQWQEVIALADKNGFVPFIDIAYQGFGESLDADAYGLRLAAEKLPEVVIASSCSKNFGLYRERTGAVMFKNYSMSPFHGGGIVGTILSDAELTADWKAEVVEICDYVNGVRRDFADLLNSKQDKKDFNFISDANKGMFSYLGIELDEVMTLRNEFGIYLLNSTRINVAGLTSSNMAYTTDSIAEVLNRR